MARVQFVNQEIYHIFNRGVDKREVFLDKIDYLRFIHDIFEFNDITPASPSNIRLKARKPAKLSSPTNTDAENQLRQCLEVKPPNIGVIMEAKPRKILVEILSWCLMPNHFHFLIRQIVEGGITLFMRKLGTGYTLYFNQKYERSGVLFQGTFKAVLVENKNHLWHLPFYIHANPLDLIEPSWREGNIKDPDRAFKFLEAYRYSSHLDFLGNKNFPSVSQRNFLIESLEEQRNYQKQFHDWIKNMNEKQLIKFKNAMLE